ALGARQAAAILFQGDDEMQPAGFSGLASQSAVLHHPGTAERKGFGEEVVRAHRSTELIPVPCQAVFPHESAKGLLSEPRYELKNPYSVPRRSCLAGDGVASPIHQPKGGRYASARLAACTEGVAK